jgi:hypothetical protein
MRAGIQNQRLATQPNRHVTPLLLCCEANFGKAPQSLPSPQAKDRKRKRTQEPEGPAIRDPSKPVQKGPRTTVVSSVVVGTLCQEATSGVTDNKVDPIDYWRRKGHWPEVYFKQDDKTRKDFRDDFKDDSELDPWYETYSTPNEGMNHLLARKKLSSSDAPTTPSDQKPREVKSTPYARPSYETVLATKGSFMDEGDLGITDTSKSFCRTLLEKDQAVPPDSLFRDDLFDNTCRKIRDRNETMVIRDIALLIVPSAQTLATYGATHLKHLTESVNEGWNSAISFYGSRPQPDYSVGFGRSAFTDDQLDKLKPFVGEIDTFASYFMATWRMYFPFLTCEVKCGTAALDIADRQNAHSMTLAVRGVVELFRLVKRENELHREILAFSISHNHRAVRIYGHYPVINGNETTFYRHPIRTFDFTELDGRDKWTAYRFTKNVYNIWIPMHLSRICSVVDELPLNINFEVSELPASEVSGLSQVFEDQSLPQASNPAISSQARNNHSQSSLAGSHHITPDTYLSQGTQGGAFKMPKKRRTAE